MENQVYTSLIFEWQQTVLGRKPGVRRDLEDRLFKTIGSRPIKIVTGFRRCGKSFLVQQVARRLLEAAEITLGNLLYLNLEDFRLMEVTNPDRLNHVYELFLSTSAGPGKKLLIFDEIQNVANWDRFIRTIYERDDDIEIILTGSNSELLSSELGSNLAGRFIEFSLSPFSFREFLDYRKCLPATTSEYQRNRLTIASMFSEYLSCGGLPEVFDMPGAEAKRSYMSGIVSKVILDDVVRRFRVDNIVLLEKLFHYLMSSAGTVMTFASLTRKAKALGIQTKSETIIAYCGYLLKAFAILELSKFNWKQDRVFSDSRKYYSVDIGIISLYRAPEENLSLRLEHVVMHELIRRHGQPWYGANDSGREIDFLAHATGREYEKYQVTVSLTQEDEKRELGAFSLADPYLHNGTNLLLSMDTDETQLQWNGVPIKRKNVIKWLLGL